MLFDEYLAPIWCFPEKHQNLIKQKIPWNFFLSQNISVNVWVLIISSQFHGNSTSVCLFPTKAYVALVSHYNWYLLEEFRKLLSKSFVLLGKFLLFYLLMKISNWNSYIITCSLSSLLTILLEKFSYSNGFWINK